MESAVIPYTLIMPSASRPHLMEPVLRSLLSKVDVKPVCVIVHDDAAFKGKQGLVQEVLAELREAFDVPIVDGYNDPPLSHGPTLKWLLDRVETPYFLYSQDDHVVVNDLPIAQCLDVMNLHALHHVRFNKRATMEFKGEFRKIEKSLADSRGNVVTLCISDHWYFQTHLGRTERLKKVVDWWMENTPTSFHEHCEVKINNAFNGQVKEFNSDVRMDVPFIGRRPEPDPATGYRMTGDNPMDPMIRDRYQKTYIWGKIGTDRFVDHIGGDEKDWSLRRGRGGKGGPMDSQDERYMPGRG